MNETPRELNLEDITAGTYFAIGDHTFMAQAMHLSTVAAPPDRPSGPPMRDLEQIDMKLVRARWKCCDA